MLNTFSATVLLSILASATHMAAATLMVGKPNTGCTQAKYTAIADALNAASAGDVIEICPALYPEQLTITKSVTLRGLGTQVSGLPVARVLIQPTSMIPSVASDAAVKGAPVEAVISVIDAKDVTIENLAVDASNSKVTGCSPLVAGIYYYNSSGVIADNAVFGAQVQGCTPASALQFGNGFGIEVDDDTSTALSVSIQQNSIHDFTRDGIQVIGAGITAAINRNSISGVGPAIGVFQFGIFIVNGPVARIQSNIITEGLCGALTVSDCIKVRSEGITLRSPGDGTSVEGNFIVNAQSGIFINGGHSLSITNNQIRNIDALSGIDIQGTASGAFTNSIIRGNVILNVGPIDQNASLNGEGCGIVEYSGTGVSANLIAGNTVNDAYCGVAAVEADLVGPGLSLNTLYPQLDSDLYPSMFPAATEP